MHIILRPVFLLIISFSIASFSCSKQDFLVPEEGFSWPDNRRVYWPTAGWETGDPGSHGLDQEKLALADNFADNDPLSRALLIVKDGQLVFEKYYHGGEITASTNLWSVSKSYSSALTGLLYDDGVIKDLNSKMKDLIPQYPEFGDITLHHVMTHTTGLSWSETGPLWVEWITADDWVSAALAKGQNHKPGKHFYYSSGNSHFMTSLAFYLTGQTPGHLMKVRIFDPIGIEFQEMDPPTDNSRWENYLIPLHQSWHKDPKGIETAGFGLFMTARDMAKFGYLYLNRGKWENQQLLSEEWINESLRDHKTNIYGRYSYGYHWWITMISGNPAFLASGFGGQIIGIVPSLDMVVVLKYDAVNPEHPVSGTAHDDIHLFELIVDSAK